MYEKKFLIKRTFKCIKVLRHAPTFGYSLKQLNHGYYSCYKLLLQLIINQYFYH